MHIYVCINIYTYYNAFEHVLVAKSTQNVYNYVATTPSTVYINLYYITVVAMT